MLYAVIIILIFLLVPSSARGEYFTQYPSWTTISTDVVRAVAVGDVDGDGDLDVVFGSSLVRMHLNTDGVLSTLPSWSPNQSYELFDLALGDVDSDGDLDLLCAYGWLGTMLFLNNGGTFSSDPVGAWPDSYCLMLGDVDNDGDLDLVCAGDSAALYLNEGSVLSSVPAWTVDTPSWTQDLVLGDIDGDGYLDLVCGNAGSIGEVNTVYRNLEGVFSSVPHWSSGDTSNTRGVELGDMDGDGDLDLVVCNEDFNNNSCLYLNSGGLFSLLPDWSAPSYTRINCIDVGDVDGDGDLDLVCGNSYEPNIVFLNEDGVLPGTPDWTSDWAVSTGAVGLGDLDGDGDLELIYGNNNFVSTVYINTSAPFSGTPSWTSNPTNSAFAVDLGDIDGDGDLDLVSASAGFGSALFLNENGQFIKTPEWTSGLHIKTWTVALGDISGDGAPDLVCGNIGYNNLFFNAGGTFVSAPSWTSSLDNSTYGIVLGDVNGDGLIDLVCGNVPGQNTVYLNLGNVLSTTPYWTSEPSNQTYDVMLDDVDGDGDLDLICGNDDYPNTVYLNNGQGFSTSPDWYSPFSSDTKRLGLGDVDGDGNRDLLCGNDRQRANLYLNHGTGFSTAPDWQSAVAYIIYGIAFSDVDADGDPDLVCGAYDHGCILYSNDRGELSAEPTLISRQDPTDFLPSRIKLGDVDQDGDLDLVCGNSNLQQAVMFSNNTSPAFKTDPLNPSSHLPNNSAFLRAVTCEQYSVNTLQIRFSAVDVESDPVWIYPEYQFEDEPIWRPVSAGGLEGRIGLFPTSPSGIEYSINWDVSLIPFDRREVVLRLKAIEIPYRVSEQQHISVYRKEIGPVQAVRPAIALIPDVLTLPMTTVGASTSVGFSIKNTGTASLVVNDIHMPSQELRAGDPQPPFSLAVGQTADIILYFEPLTASNISDVIQISSNDPLQPVLSVPISAEVRDLGFSVAQLYPDGEIGNGENLNVSIVMHDSVHADSARILFRAGGTAVWQATRLNLMPDPKNEQYFGTILAQAILASGIEYYIQVYNGPYSINSEINRLRKWVSNLEFTFTTGAQVYRLLSVPLEMQGTIIGSVSDDLGGQDNTQWRMFAYDKPRANYIEVPNDSLYSFEHGQAYWLISKQSKQLDTGPAMGLSTPTDSAFSVHLESGWNLISNPFNFEVCWDSVLIDSMKIVDLDSLIAEPPVGWSPINKSYHSANTLLPFEGYWVKNLSSAGVTLRIPPQEHIIPAEGKPPLLARGNPPVSLLNQWALDVHASTGGAFDTDNHFGVDPNSREAWDNLDRSEPPANPGHSLSLYFPHHGWSKHAGNYTSDFRGAYEILPPEFSTLASLKGEAGGHAWIFDVAKNFTNDPCGDDVELIFSGVESVPAEAEIALVDRVLGCVIDLRRHQLYRYILVQRNVVTRQADARFMVLVGSEAFIQEQKGQLPGLPERTVLHQNYPNPFNPSTMIHYEVARVGRVALRVYDVTGAVIAVLEDRWREPGRYEINWNGENDHGQRVTSGIYFYRLDAGGATQTRKMSLLK